MHNLTIMDTVCGSTFWNSSLTWYSEDPYFTQCFEKTALVWLPCIFLWIFSPLEFYYIKNSEKQSIPWNCTNSLKLLCTAYLCVLTLSDLGSNWFRNEVAIVDIITPLVKLATFTLVGLLCFYDKKHGIQSSGVVFIFWFLMALCATPQLRSEITHRTKYDMMESSYEYVSYLAYYPAVIFMFLANCFSDSKPKSKYLGKEKQKNPEDGTSFLSRLFFCWFDALMLKGFRKPLVFDDFWNLKEDDTADYIVPIFEKEWEKAVHSKNKGQQNSQSNRNTARVSIIPVLARIVMRKFIFGAFLKLVGDVILFVNPQVLSLIIGYVNSSEPQWKGIFYALLLFSAASARSIMENQCILKMVSIGIRIRTASVSAIYRKSLKISNAARKDRTVGEIVNLFAVDSQRLLDMPLWINSLWSFPLQICLALYFLWQELGPSVLAGVAVMVLLIPLNVYIGRKLKTFQLGRLKIRDIRIKYMNEIMNGIKVLKLYAWETSFEEQVSKIRANEIKFLTKAAYLKAENNFMWNYAPFVVSLLTFATYVLIDENNVLDANKAFVSLSLFNILRGPLNQLPNEINNMIQTYVSVKRINDFMNAEDLDPNSVTHDKIGSDAIIVEDGTFSWELKPILKNINIRVPENNLTAVVGTVGAGKSSLLAALLGEMDKKSGIVNTFGSISYVPQQAWIQNATLKDNILFGKEFDRQLYDKVIEACALKPDLEMLPGGDDTEIGEKGINLSGGQKQRVSLARAVYYNSDIYLLDDPLSAVDSHVGKHIFDKVLGPKGLLNNKTRVLVTHGITYLPQVDNIFVLKDGCVSERGTYQELLNEKGDIAEFLLNHIQEDTEINDEEMAELKDQMIGSPIEDQVKEEIGRILPRTPSVTNSDRGSNATLNTLVRQRSTEQNRKGQGDDIQLESRDNDKEPGVKLIEQEKTETGTVHWPIYKHYLTSLGTYIILMTLVMNVGFQGFGVGTNIWLGVWADDSQMFVNGTVDTGRRDMYLIVYAALGLAQALCTLAANMLFALGTMNAARTLHDYLLHNVMRLPMAFFDVTPCGRILARFSSDIVGIDIRLPNDFNNLILNMVKVVATLFVISYTTPLFIAVIIPIGLIYIFLQRYYVASSRQINRLLSVSRSPVYSHVGETMNGVHVIRAYWQQNRFIKDSESKMDYTQMCVYNNNISNRWSAVRLEILSNVILLFAALFAVLGQDMLPSMVGLSISYAQQITSTMMLVVRSTAMAETNIVAVERIKEYGEKKREAEWELPNKSPPKSWPNQGQLEYKDYSVRYRPGLDLVLKKVNFKVNSGEKIGIVGRTGAGKSSLTLSLFRIIEAAGGSIQIDNINIAELGLHTLRSKLTIIPQDAVLFSGSLRMNIDPFETYSDDELWDSLEHAHLKEFVKSLPAMLHHEVSEGGENLSAGQRQLICLARALLRKSKILILDEATAAVDLETDALIQKTIRIAFKDSTVLTIAHRLNTIMDSDRVLVMDRGQVAEFDTPFNLLKNSGSIFYEMCKDAKLV